MATQITSLGNRSLYFISNRLTNHCSMKRQARILLNHIQVAGNKTYYRLVPQEGLIWKAPENDPRKHTYEHLGLLYELPNEKDSIPIFGHPSPFDPETREYYKRLGVNGLMIRKPFLQAIDYLKRVDYSKPNIRILFYGDKGTGKTHIQSHLLHYLHLNQDHIIFQIREMKKFTRCPKGGETSESTSRPGRIDTPINAAMVLQQFKIQNSSLLERLKDTLICTRDYTWSIREVTKAGEPLVNVAEHGINRVNHASDCLAVVIKELILAADEGKIKLASILDNVRFLYTGEAGILKHVDGKKVLIDEITVARGIKKLIDCTYKGGIVLASCDNKFSKKQNQTPREVLGIEGWNAFDPFLPINVGKYTKDEYENMMNFFQDIGWITRPEAKTRELRDEFRFISGLNPLELAQLCSAI